ncbi:MAG: gatB [Chlamydiales bacterium]|jgi:aspartyl-tRNA(Asn)/glutamyl-tRNA(Gln) amidotransferase subunit B|nr:gatB [Chlamydiales bacterium]
MKHSADWETIIGLEIHAELNTRSKLFSSAPNHFGDAPNCNISEVCTGQPGALPVLNQAAVDKAILFGVAIGSEICKFSKFDRKSYFYPDSPRNFQITQFEDPIIKGGMIIAELDGERREFAIDRAHLEDDAGMLKHFTHFAGVDYNRAGVPLIEIVSKPCMHSPKEASAYAMAVRAILQYLDVCDCNMQEGSLRMDANVSVRLKGETYLRNKIEIKNMNSFSNMEMALESEIKRQIKAYQDNPDKPALEVIIPSTYRFDPDKRETVLMRRKETSDDYRYFPEPDLPPILLSDERIEAIRQSLPELPLERQDRYMQAHGMSADMAFQLTFDKKVADYFERCLKTNCNARSLANWILVEFSGRLKEKGLLIVDTAILPEHVASLVAMIDQGTITGKIAKKVADEMVLSPGKDPASIVKENPDFTPLSDDKEIEQLVDSVLKGNEQSVQDYLQGKERAFGFLVGQVMKLSKGKAQPEKVNALLKMRLSQT